LRRHWKKKEEKGAMSDGGSSSPTRHDLGAARRELLETLLEEEGIDLQSAVKIRPRQCFDNLPLSFAQERLWFLDQLEPGNPVYNICRAYRLTGPLDLNVLTLSLDEVVHRHEVLRTTFPAVDGRPIQLVAGDLTLIVKVIELQELTWTDREAELLRIAIEECQQSFDLALGPLLRVAWLRISEEDHLLVFTVHQIICDGWSAGIFFRELEKIYDTFSNGQSLTLPPPPVQYADFALFQRQWVNGGVLESLLSYWKNQLGGVVPMLELPTDRPRPSVQTFRGARQTIELSTSMTASLKELSRQEGATLFVILMAAFNTLLHRYTTQEDIIVGFAIANRNYAEIQNAIGFFVNTFPLRADLSGNPTFREVLLRVRTVCIAAHAHQDLPFEKLVEELHQERDLSHNPLFKVMFVFQNVLDPVLKFRGVKSTPVGINTGTSKFDLTLSLGEREQTLVGFFEYSTDLFERSSIERMIGHFQTLLEGIIADPDQPISTLPLLTGAERHQLLVEWNSTRVNFPEAWCLHKLFEIQVDRTPDAVAVVFENQWLTYGQLNAQANQLARHLKQRGVGPDKIVGICLERSLEMVVGLLGILKAGGAYLPLDPAHPSERLTFMLEDAQVSVLLIKGRLKSNFPEYDGDVVCLDSDSDIIATYDQQNPFHDGTAEDLAYVIFTSGSTGKPKGVMITHQSICNRLLWMQDAFRLTEFDRVLQKTPFSFDVSVWEIFWPLLNGARLVIARPGGHQDSDYLVNLIANQRITVLHFVPSMLRVFLEQPSLDGCDCLRLVICSGEVLRFELQEHFFARLEAELYNLYGPTEAAIDVTYWACERGSNRSTIPIGRPIANTQIYILDSNMQPVPIGVPGELHIGGDGLARGYLNRPELSAEKFVENPFSSESGSRLYKTGDRARYLPDGNIEFLGRLDNQIKIRGYRIEPGEIETALDQHSEVKESVIVAREAESSVERELVAYIVPKRDSIPSVTELRNFLAAKIPEYLIPRTFVMLKGLPLMHNGKVYRNALPPPDGERPKLQHGFVEPRTEVQEMVAQVWREVLKIDRIGIYDNFFELGGHSLLATRVVARLRGNFNIDLPLRKLFELPTVADLAEHIDFLRRNQSGVSIPSIKPVPRDRSIPLSFSQRRLWFLQKLDPNLTAYNIPATFRIKGDLNISALEKALSEIVNRHEVLRTRIIEIDGEPFQEIVSPLTFMLPVTDLSHLLKEQAEAEVQALSIDDARQLYALGDAPLMRATLLWLGEQEYVLILNFHHIVCDGSSLIMFYHELAMLYEAFLDDKVCTLPPLPVQYADYAVWQHERLQGEVLESELAYWKRQLGTGLTTLNLPIDYERPVVQTYRGARLTRTLSEELTKGLKDLCRREGVTLFMTLLASLNILLSRHTGQDDIIVGSTIAGRNRPETDGLIGFFINALALRADLSGNPTFPELLKRIREVCLDGYTHQDLPFERVVEEINPQRELSRNPLFQVMFNLADTSERVLKLAGCQTIKLSPYAPEAKFDIVLHAPEVDGRIELAIVYNVDLFNEHRIVNVLDQFTYLLSQVADHPLRGIDEFSLVTPSAVSVIPNPTESLDDTWEGSIHELFAKQAERTPDFPAVIDPDERWSYSELDRRSNQLANYLIAHGIKPKDVVTIYAQRSAALVIALLGVLKAGAAFVILDPAYPASRLISYLRIARPHAWLHIEDAGEMSEELREFLTTLDLCCQLMIPSRKLSFDSDPLKTYSELNPNLPIQADDPAYIAFTSGSTGEPKGVLSRHGPITHFLPWQRESFELAQTDRFALLSGLAYNHLHRDMFTALYLGAPLYIPEPQLTRSPEQLAEWLQQNEITILHLTPALGQLLLTAGEKTLPSIRWPLFGGDVLTWSEVARIRRLAPNAKMGSFYGATETQRAVGYFQIPGQIPVYGTDANRAVPLGRGIKNVQLLLLNKRRQLAGIAELGELYVRSPHLATGYIGDEKRTQEMFVINPFTNDAKDRMYKTGELGRYLPDGNVEWAGRNDRRINIRGFRVELEEVETILKQHPAVSEVAVVVQNYEVPTSENPKSEVRNRESDRRLVAYVVTVEEGESFIDLLRSFLNARLPDYMVPSYFVVLDRLPLSPNGKVDYEALPVAEPLTGPTDSFIEPRNEFEAKLCEIFSQVLGIERVGANDNFFRLGGHSLLAAQAAARIKEAFGVELELRTFLESPTVAALAGQVELLFSAGQQIGQSAKDEREEFEI
jgi:amino acid adenylation domain-containing protein